MTVQDDNKTKFAAERTCDKPKSMGRRALLRGGVTAMPAILTLHSGAALARSSNLISATPYEGGDAWCMETSTAELLSDGKYDYGDLGNARVNVLPDSTYYAGPGYSNPIGSAETFCNLGGSGNYKSPYTGKGETAVLQGPGIVVSSNAYNSISSRITIDGGLPKHWP